MDIHVGLNDFKSLVQTSPLTESNFERWLPYYREYRAVFDVLIEKIYMSRLDQLSPLINNLDLEDTLVRAENSMEKHPVVSVEKKLEQCMRFFNSDFKFDVFMLVGLDGIDGAAPPSDNPLLFLGLECMNDSDLSVLIPHEFNHLCRFQFLKGLEDTSNFSVKQLSIAEGLATLTPLLMNDEPLTNENLTKALMVTRDDYKALQNQTEVISLELSRDFDQPLSPAMMSKYFMANEWAYLPKKSGYFYGVKIIISLLKNGYSLKDLTYKATEEISRLYEQYKTEDA